MQFEFDLKAQQPFCVKEELAKIIKKNLVATPNISHHIVLDNNIEYKDLIACWNYFKCTDLDYINNFNLGITLDLTPEIEAYSIVYKQYPLLQQLFQYVTKINPTTAINNMVIFYIKNKGEFLVMLRSDDIWTMTIENIIATKRAEAAAKDSETDAAAKDRDTDAAAKDSETEAAAKDSEIPVKIHSPFWLFYLAIPSTLETFNNYFIENNFFNPNSICIFVY